MKHQLSAAGLAVGLVAGSAAGLVLVPVAAVGQTSAPPTSPPRSGDVVEHAADPGFRAALAPLVADGTLTQGQADKVVAALGAVAPAGRHKGARFHVSLDTAASVLGVTQEQLHQALQSGQSLADVATSRGIAPQSLVDALVAEVKTRLDAKVAAGTLTQAQAATRLAEARRMITAMVNGERPKVRDGRLRGPAFIPAPPAGDAEGSADPA